MVRVAAIEDHQVLVDALSLLLCKEEEMTFIGSAGTLTEGLEMVRGKKPDVLLLDVSLPDGNGLDYIPQFQEHSPKTQILVLTTFTDESTLRRAIDCGVSGFLSKGSPLSDLLKAIHQAAEGEMVVPASLLISLLKRQTRDKGGYSFEMQDWEPLTPRELEILKSLAKGKSGVAIASELHIAPLTVRTHVRNLLNKLGAHSRLEAVSFGLKYGLIDSPA